MLASPQGSASFPSGKVVVENLEEVAVFDYLDHPTRNWDGTSNLHYMCYYKKGLYEKAVEMLERAVKLVADDPIILEHLGDAYIKMNDNKKALEYYNRSLKHQKKDKEKIEKKIQTLTEKGSES